MIIICIYTLFVNNKPEFHLMNKNSAKIDVKYTFYQCFLQYRTCAWSKNNVSLLHKNDIPDLQAF